MAELQKIRVGQDFLFAKENLAIPSAPKEYYATTETHNSTSPSVT